MSEKGAKQNDARDALPADLQAEADALELDSLDSTATPPGNVASAADAPPDHETGDMIAGLLLITTSQLLVPMRGEHWKMTPDECTALGRAYGAVIDKYLPGFSGGVEVTAIILTLTAFGPRIAQDIAAAAEDGAGLADAA